MSSKSRIVGIAEVWTWAFLSVFNLPSTAGFLGSEDLAATSGVAKIEGFLETAGVEMSRGFSATFLFELLVVASVVCFVVNWTAAEVVFEDINFSVVAVVLVLFGVHMVASDAFLWRLGVVPVSFCVFFILGTVSFVFFETLSEVGLWPWLVILACIALSRLWLWC